MKKLIYISNKFNFSPAEYKAMGEIFKDAGQVFFAGLLIDPIANGRFRSIPLIIGVVFSSFTWYIYFNIQRRMEV